MASYPDLLDSDVDLASETALAAPPAEQASVDIGSWFAWALVIVGGCAALVTYQTTRSPEGALIVGASFAIPGIAMSPLVGLCLVVLSVPLESMVALLPGGMTLTRTIALLTAGVFLPRMLGRSFRQAFYSRTAQLHYLPALWLLVTFPFALSPEGGWIEATTHLSLLGLVFLVSAVPKDIRQLRMLCLTATFGAAMLAIYIAVFGTGGLITNWSSQNKFAGTAEHTIGGSLALGLILSAVVWRDAGTIFRVAILAMDIFIMFGIGLTNSRTTWASLLAGALLAPLITRRISAKQRMIFVGCAILVALVGFLLVFGDVFGDTGKLVRYRMMTMFDTAKGPGTSGRLEYVWPLYWGFIQGHFLLGGGWGTFFYLGVAPHNDMLGALAYGGAIGGLLYLVFYLVAFREAGRNTDPWFRLVTVMMCVMILVAGQFTHSNISKTVSLTVGVLGAMANLGYCPRRRTTTLE